jgi:hypothetical protein
MKMSQSFFCRISNGGITIGGDYEGCFQTIVMLIVLVQESNEIK